MKRRWSERKRRREGPSWSEARPFVVDPADVRTPEQYWARLLDEFRGLGSEGLNAWRTVLIAASREAYEGRVHQLDPDLDPHEWCWVFLLAEAALREINARLAKEQAA